MIGEAKWVQRHKQRSLRFIICVQTLENIRFNILTDINKTFTFTWIVLGNHWFWILFLVMQTDLPWFFYFHLFFPFYSHIYAKSGTKVKVIICRGENYLCEMEPQSSESSVVSSDQELTMDNIINNVFLLLLDFFLYISTLLFPCQSL